MDDIHLLVLSRILHKPEPIGNHLLVCREWKDFLLSHPDCGIYHQWRRLCPRYRLIVETYEDSSRDRVKLIFDDLYKSSMDGICFTISSYGISIHRRMQHESLKRGRDTLVQLRDISDRHDIRIFYHMGMPLDVNKELSDLMCETLEVKSFRIQHHSKINDYFGPKKDDTLRYFHSNMGTKNDMANEMLKKN